MSFVPVTGPATFRVGEPPREGVVEFTGGPRDVVLPVRAALPVLGRVHREDDVHPSVALLGSAALLGLRLVAAGRFEPAASGARWQVAPLGADDEDRVVRLAHARVPEGMDADEAEALVRAMLEAVVDTMPRTPPAGPASPHRRRAPVPGAAGGPPRVDDDFTRRLEERIERVRRRGRAPVEADLPQLVTLVVRVEADEEELVAGSVRLVLAVQAADNPAHMCDAALLWAESGPDASHGFGERARTHATMALRSAAEAWPVLDRLLDLRVPDEITLDTDELLSLLDEGVAALDAAGVQVLWPRYLDRSVTSKVVLGHGAGPGRAGPEPREEALQDGLFGPDALFSFSWQLALHGEALTEEEMDRLAAAATPIIKIRDNWTVVDSGVIKRARRRMIRTVPPATALAATLTDVVRIDDIEHEAVVGASLLTVRERITGAATRDPIPVPAGLAAELRDYQRHGLTWLAELTSLGLGACLADDMGLGKTITLIALHLHRHEGGFDTLAPLAAQPAEGGGPTLVVCPASLLGNWEAEVRRFAPGVPVRRFHGTGRSLAEVAGAAASPGPSGGDPGFVLTTYGTLRNDAEALATVRWGLVVADEAQHVKNSRSATARALRSIPGEARVALTGTPVENDLSELWSILDWAIPGLLGSRNAFRKVWAAPIESGLEPTKARQFADLVSPFLLRRRKSDPGIAPELPAKTETDHLIGLTREQVVLYETYVRDCMERIERADDEASRRGLVLKLLTGLKQICNHPAQFLRQHSPGQANTRLRLTGRSEKLDLLDELVGTVLAEDGAVLVFTQYVALARLLELHLSRTGIPHQFLHGGTPVAGREAMVERFQSGEVPVFLLSLKAGGTGLNLTRADHVIHVDRWWNPAVEEQATDRAYRIGQTRPVQVHRFVTQGTIEERIAELLARKRHLADAVLGRGEVALTELDDAQLRDLVELR